MSACPPILQPAHAPGPWQIVESFNGFKVTRSWSDGMYQVLCAGWLKTHAEAETVLAKVTGGAA